MTVSCPDDLRLQILGRVVGLPVDVDVDQDRLTVLGPPGYWLFVSHRFITSSDQAEGSELAAPTNSGAEVRVIVTAAIDVLQNDLELGR